MKNELTHLIVGNVGTIRANAGLNYNANNWTLAATFAYGHPYGEDSTTAHPANMTGRWSISPPIIRSASGRSASSVTARMT